MNILASYNWIKEFLPTDLSAEEFAARMTDAGNSVEHLQSLAQTYDHMVIGLVKEVKPHPNADKLKVAVTDIGKETVEIVCGGVNLAEGMRVAVGLPGAKVRWHGEGELVELAKTKIRGVESIGMICAVEEIGFEKLATGKQDIWDLTELVDAKPGTPLADALDLHDTIFDIEATSNRPDCMSIIGQAREGAAVIEGVLQVPEAKISLPSKPTTQLQVCVEEPELCPNYSAVLLEQVQVKPSPWWLQKKLLLAGHRPINNVVDITNYILHEFGQPLHAFDADQLEGNQIVVRRAKKNETLEALDEKNYALSSDMLVIADAKKPVAVAGVMGGRASGTTQTTTRVVIESATFDPVSVRKTARALNLYSDSQLLFEKGLSTQATRPAIERAIELMCQLTGAQVVSELVEEVAHPYEPLQLPFDPKRANDLMGIELAEKDMLAMLARLGFESSGSAKTGLTLTVPYWRDHDIEHSVDFTEEIARIYGYAHFPSVLPTGEVSTESIAPELTWVRRLKQLAVGMGLSEFYSYSFVSQTQLEKAGFDAEKAVGLRNPLSLEFAYMRPSLVPSLLSAIEANQARVPEMQVFEIAPIYLPRKNDIPDQPLRMVMATTGRDAREVFGRAKGMLERLFRQTGIDQMAFSRTVALNDWHPGRSAQIIVQGKPMGTIGQIADARARAFGLDVIVVVVELDLETLIPLFTQKKSYTAIPEFPSVKRDLACVVKERVEYQTLVDACLQASSLLAHIELFDVYRGKGIEDGQKSLALHLEFRAHDRTLESKEVDVQMDQLRDVLQSQFGAIMRS